MYANYTKMIGAIVALLAGLGLVVVLLFNESTDNQSTKALQETIQTTASANRDDSSRVMRGVFVLDRKPFESSFVSTLANSRGLGFRKITKSNIKFTYLVDKSNGKDLNGKLVDKNGNKVANDYTKPTADYVAVKGVRVLIDDDKNGSYTDKADYVATVYIDARSGDGFISKQ